MTKKFLFFGFGYTAEALSRRLPKASWRLAATARGPDQAAGLAAKGIEPFLLGQPGLDARALADAAAILVSAPPDEEGCPAFRALSEALPARARQLQWIGYLSSNAVYGDHQGAWIDENSPLKATRPRALARIGAEAQWAGLAVEWSLPFAIFRLPGIYGAGRSAFDAIREGRARRVFKAGQVFNRMHVDDIAAALEASLKNPSAGELFNLADDEPAPPQDVIEYAAALLGLPPPPLVPIEQADLSEMAQSFYADNKRVRNTLMKEALGLALAYPTYREGLAAILPESRGGQ